MIERDELCELIPHTGKMCLLDRVIRWDKTFIECESRSHTLSDNPLRSKKRLPAVSLIEYGAQAMAVHGGLLAREEGRKISNGYLAALRDVKINKHDINSITDKICIQAECLMAQGGNLIYEFRIKSAGTAIIQGRATVVGEDMPILRVAE